MKSQDILQTIETVMPHALKIGGADALTELATDVRHGYSDANWLLECRTIRGSLPDVVREAAGRWSGTA